MANSVFRKKRNFEFLLSNGLSHLHKYENKPLRSPWWQWWVMTRLRPTVSSPITVWRWRKLDSRKTLRIILYEIYVFVDFFGPSIFFMNYSIEINNFAYLVTQNFGKFIFYFRQELHVNVRVFILHIQTHVEMPKLNSRCLII